MENSKPGQISKESDKLNRQKQWVIFSYKSVQYFYKENSYILIMLHPPPPLPPTLPSPSEHWGARNGFGIFHFVELLFNTAITVIAGLYLTTFFSIFYCPHDILQVRSFYGWGTVSYLSEISCEMSVYSSVTVSLLLLLFCKSRYCVAYQSWCNAKCEHNTGTIMVYRLCIFTKINPPLRL